MPTEPVPLVTPRAPTDPRTLPSMRTLLQYARCLQITHEEVHTLQTIGSLQALAKQRYRLLARRTHPDSGGYLRAAKQREAGLAAATETERLQTKDCRTCQTTQPLAAFVADRRYSEKRRSECKLCHNARRAQRPAIGIGAVITIAHDFQRITRAYKALLAIPAHVTLGDIRLASLHSARKEPLPLYEPPLPFALERRTLALGYGWQESMERYWY